MRLLQELILCFEVLFYSLKMSLDAAVGGGNLHLICRSSPAAAHMNKNISKDSIDN